MGYGSWTIFKFSKLSQFSIESLIKDQSHIVFLLCRKSSKIQYWGQKQSKDLSCVIPGVSSDVGLSRLSFLETTIGIPWILSGKYTSGERSESSNPCSSTCLFPWVSVVDEVSGDTVWVRSCHALVVVWFIVIQKFLWSKLLGYTTYYVISLIRVVSSTVRESECVCVCVCVCVFFF